MGLNRRVLRTFAIWTLLLLLPALYGLSYVRTAAIIWLGGGRPSVAMFSTRGNLSLTAMPAAATVDSPPSFNVLMDRPDEDVKFMFFSGSPEPELSSGGMEFYSEPFEGVNELGRVRLFQLPYWIPCIPIAWIILRRIRRARLRRIRTRRGLCLTCGYDLRATTDRCPECGTAVA